MNLDAGVAEGPKDSAGIDPPRSDVRFGSPLMSADDRGGVEFSSDDDPATLAESSFGNPGKRTPVLHSSVEKIFTSPSQSLIVRHVCNLAGVATDAAEQADPRSSMPLVQVVGKRLPIRRRQDEPVICKRGISEEPLVCLSKTGLARRFIVVAIEIEFWVHHGYLPFEDEPWDVEPDGPTARLDVDLPFSKAMYED
ncbi:hypothetical protein EHW12_32740 (plasmid) [Rhodococcus sp. NJ-530]|nr:hypothetical protein EHW12_32740 [Rhodococcus sp. NJ-530]